MKKIFILVLLVLGSFSLFSAETLTFKIDNPRFIRRTIASVTRNYLEFNVLVKATANGTYFYSAQVFFNVNAGNFNTSVTPGFIKGAAFSQSYDFGTGAIPVYSTTNTWASGNLCTSIYAVLDATGFEGDTPGLFSPITTSYQLLGTVRVAVLDANIGSLAGISFLTSAMDGYAKYETYGGGGPWTSEYYASPNFYNGQDLKYIYTGRLYSSGSGWSQVNGPVNVITNHWNIALNTTVWDTSSSAATIDTALALAGKFRIYAGARVKINPGKGLTCSDSTIINSVKGLWISSDATGTGSFIDNGNILYAGTALVQRWVGHDQWHYVGFPIHTVMARANLLQLYVKYYDETRSVTYDQVADKWRYVIDPVPTPDSSISTMRGYAIWSNNVTTGDKTISFEGSVSNNLYTGAQTASLTRSAFTGGAYANDGWNLVANYYPSPIDMEAVSGWSRTNIDATYYFWDGLNGQYVNYNYLTHVGNGNPLLGTRYIPAMQGYFVHVTSGTSATLGTDNPVRVTSSQAFWKNTQAYNDNLILMGNANGYADEAQVIFDQEATTGFDPMYDAYKLFGGTDAPQLYTVLTDNNIASVNFSPWTGTNQVIPLNFYCGVSGNYSITASNISSFRPGVEIYLEDKKIPGNAWTNLKTNPVYNFSYTYGDAVNRFILHFTNIYFGIPEQKLTTMQIYSFEDVVYIKNIGGKESKGDVFIYDLTGRKVFEDKLQNTPVNQYRLNVNEGYYLVQLVTPDNTYHQKVYIK
jgi:hypothetical protein